MDRSNVDPYNTTGIQSYMPVFCFIFKFTYYFKNIIVNEILLAVSSLKSSAGKSINTDSLLKSHLSIGKMPRMLMYACNLLYLLRNSQRHGEMLIYCALKPVIYQGFYFFIKSLLNLLGSGQMIGVSIQ
jgi:hypothetical protein